MGVHRIRLQENKPIPVVQDELGFQLGREGGSMVEYWRKGYLPKSVKDVSILARELVRRGGLDRAWLDSFLACAEYPHRSQLLRELWPDQPAPAEMISDLPIGLPVARPDGFFGRRDELARMFLAWRSRPMESVAVMGRRRSGKTSLLLHAMRMLTARPEELRPSQRQLAPTARTHTVYVDFQDARMRTRDRLLPFLLSSLGLPVPAPCDLFRFLDVASERLDTPAIFLFDSLEAALTAPELDQDFWWSLRALVSTQTRGNLALVTTSLISPTKLAQTQERTSPFFNIFGTTCTLGPLHRTEAREMIDTSLPGLCDDDMEWILAESGGWPLLLQILLRSRALARDDRDWRDIGHAQCQPFAHLLRPQQAEK
jgi:hypothetical protein